RRSSPARAAVAGGRRACRRGRARSTSWPGEDAARQDLDAALDRVVGTEGPFGAVPAPDPAQCAGDREGRQLRVARRERAVLDAARDQVAELAVDLGLEAAQ